MPGSSCPRVSFRDTSHSIRQFSCILCVITWSNTLSIIDDCSVFWKSAFVRWNGLVRHNKPELILLAWCRLIGVGSEVCLLFSKNHTQEIGLDSFCCILYAHRISSARAVVAPRFLYLSSLMKKRYLAMLMWLCEDNSLPVAVRISKTRVLKLPNEGEREGGEVSWDMQISTQKLFLDRKSVSRDVCN